MKKTVNKKTQKILDLVERLIESEDSETTFVAGETYIRTSGASWNSKEVSALVQLALERWYTDGKNSYEFERLMATQLKQRHFTLCNSGSSANLLAVSSLTSKTLKNPLKAGDEVITAACGFPTTVNPIVQNGLVPVFVDIQLPTYNALPNAIEEAITSKTRAIILAHTLGNPFKAKEIQELAERNELLLIADSCDAAGAEYDGQPLPFWADISTFSFYPAHQISLAEGGGVATNNSRLNKVIRSFRDWGRDCFPAGTKIESNGLIKNIEDVEVGDLVISHTGELRAVTKLTGKLDTEFVSVKPRNMKEIVCTSNHPFLNRGGNWTPACELKKGDFVLEALPKKIGNSPTEFSYSYETGYEVKHNAIPIEPSLMRLIGYWLAEGSLSSGKKGGRMYKEGNNYQFHRVDFSFNLREEETINDVCELMYKYFGVVGRVRQSRKGSWGASLEFKTRKGYEFFLQFFGRGATGKRLPHNMINWDLSLGISELVKGFWVGDGSSSKQGFSLCSTSETLINQVRRLLLRFEIVGSFHERKPNQHNQSVVNGRTVISKNTLHSINFYGGNADKFSKIIGESFQKHEYKGGGVFFDENYVYYPIESIKRDSTSKPVRVYNLEVEEDHSYHAGGIAVHNCWCLTGKDNTCGKRFDWQLGTLPHGFDHKYIYSEIGYNLKATDLQAVLGIGQAKRLPKFVETRRQNWEFYRKELGEIERFSEFFVLPEPTRNSKPSWFGFMLTVKENAPFTRRDLITYLEENKIGTRMLFAGNLTRHPAYEGVKYRVSGSLAKSDRVADNGFWIGVAPIVTRPMQEYVVGKIKEFVKKR